MLELAKNLTQDVLFILEDSCPKPPLRPDLWMLSLSNLSGFMYLLLCSCVIPYEAREPSLDSGMGEKTRMIKQSMTPKLCYFILFPPAA